MKKIKIDKRTGLVVSAIALGLLTGCGNKQTEKTDTAATETVTEATTEAVSEEKGVYLTQEQYDELMSLLNEDEEVEEVEEETTEEFTPGDLDIDSDASIENEVESIYEANAEWYDKMSMDKDDIRDIIYIANDKYTDESGKLIIDEDRAAEAYANIERIMGNAGLQEYNPILETMDNINTIEEEANSRIEEEVNSGIETRVQDEYNYDITEYPSLTQYIDTDKAGGKVTVEKLEEFEELRDYEVKTMNETGKYDRDRINEFVDNMELTKYNSNGGNKGGTDKNGQEYIIAAYKDAALQFAAKANPNWIYLEGYGYDDVYFRVGNIANLQKVVDKVDDSVDNRYEETVTGMYVRKVADNEYTTVSGTKCIIKEDGTINAIGTTKINYTNKERMMMNDLITMTQNGTLDPKKVDSVLNEIDTNKIVETVDGLAYCGEEQEILDKYSISNDEFRFILSWAHATTTMTATKYQEDECDEENETYQDIEIKRNESSLLVGPTKILKLC